MLRLAESGQVDTDFLQVSIKQSKASLLWARKSRETQPVSRHSRAHTDDAVVRSDGKHWEFVKNEKAHIHTQECHCTSLARSLPLLLAPKVHLGRIEPSFHGGQRQQRRGEVSQVAVSSMRSARKSRLPRCTAAEAGCQGKRVPRRKMRQRAGEPSSFIAARCCKQAEEAWQFGKPVNDAEPTPRPALAA